MLGDVNKLFVFKSILTMPSNVLPFHLKQTFPPIIWLFTEGEGDGIKSRLPFKIIFTLYRVDSKLIKTHHCATASTSFPMPWMVSVHLRLSPFLYDGLFCPFGGLLIVRPGLSGAILHWSGLVHFASRLWPPRHSL